MMKSIDVRKYSYCKETLPNDNADPATLLNAPSLGSTDWYHFPYRSDISINFIPLTSTFDQHSCKIKLLWRATVLEDLAFSETGYRPPILILCKRPTIGVKYLTRDETGIVRNRFQLSFHDEQGYIACLASFQQFGFPIRDYESFIGSRPLYTDSQRHLSNIPNPPFPYPVRYGEDVRPESNHSSSQVHVQEGNLYGVVQREATTPVFPQYDTMRDFTTTQPVSQKLQVSEKLSEPGKKDMSSKDVIGQVEHSSTTAEQSSKVEQLNEALESALGQERIGKSDEDPEIVELQKKIEARLKDPEFIKILVKVSQAIDLKEEQKE